jgi:hypothetical protein
MNGLEELRSTLDRHAADVVDHDLGGRVGSVHQRIGAVRRQRRAVAAGAAALTLAVVGAVALVPQWGERSAPEPATVAGVPVPDTMNALGYTFGFVEGFDGDGKVVIDLESSDRPRLVSWGTEGGNDVVEITEGKQVSTYEVPDFSDYLWVGPGEELSMSVSGTGQVGLAVYDLTDGQPAGVTGGGVTFRETVGDDRLLGATIGEPGESEVTVSTVAAGTSLDFRFFCAHGPKNATLHVDDGEGEVFGSSCEDEAPFDPAGGTTYGVENTQGRDLTVRLWVTVGEHGPLLDSDEVVLGLGVYENGAPTRSAGFDVPNVLEHDGHLWQPYSFEPSELGDRSLEAYGTPGPPVLAMGYYHSVSDAIVELEHSVTGESTRLEGVGGGGGAIGLLTSPSDEARIRVIGDMPDDARLMVVLFEQVS